MDWQAFAMAWGPAIPILLVLVKILCDVVYKVVPDGFLSIQNTLDRLESKANKRHKRYGRRADKRHREHMAAMLAVQAALENDKPPPRVKRRAKKP